MAPDDEARRLAAYIECREDFYFFVRYMFKAQRGYRWTHNWHHRVICDALMRVYAGKCPRLIINIPPRYSKTFLVVIYFVAWCMGKTPDCEFIHTSYGTRLAIKNSWEARNVVEHPAYREIFPETILNPESRAKDEWKTSRGGVMYAVGAGGTITGYGAGKAREEFGGCLLLDDMLKPDDARSETMRESSINFFQNTLESRQNQPGRTPIVLIMQRLHEEDLAGWLIGGGNGEVWEHINMPALRVEDGKKTALWPHMHTVEQLEALQRAKPYGFSGQYQQAPAPPEGNIFRPGQISIVDAIPAGVVRWVRGWDLASVEKDGDWTVGVRLGELSDGRYIIADVSREQESPDNRDATLKNTAALDTRRTHISLPQDPGQAGKSQVVAFAKLLRGYTVHTSSESGDKVVRAEPFASQVNVGNVMMLANEKWNKQLVDEFRMFPNGLHDDIVDAASRAFNYMNEKKGGMRINKVAARRLAGS